MATWLSVSETLIPRPVPASGDIHTEGPAAPSVSMSKPPHCPARTRLYRNGQLLDEGFPAAHIGSHLAEDPDTVVWLDLQNPEAEDLHVVTSEFGLHPLAVEDAVHDHQRPKLDRYESHLFASMYAVGFDRATGRLTTGEINAFITPRALITIRKTHFDVDTLLDRWDATAEHTGTGIGSLVHGLIDAVVDGHVHAVQQLHEAVEELEEALFDTGADVHRRGFALRRSQIRLRRVIVPMRELLADLERGEHDVELVTDSLRPYFEDVNDHALRAIEGVDAARDLLASLLDTNYAEKSDQLNEITKKLAAWAAVIAVPTAVTGFYGQNVPFPGFGRGWGFVVSLLLIIGVGGYLYTMLRKRNWL
jgi:magnesium transporter